MIFQESDATENQTTSDYITMITVVIILCVALFY